MAKKAKKEEVKKVQEQDFADYGDFLRAKREQEAKSEEPKVEKKEE